MKAYWKGKHLSEETKRKLSLSHKGKKLHSEEEKQKRRERMTGNKINKGRVHTEEYKKKMSDRLKGRKTPWLIGKPSPMKGKKFSEEHRKKLSISLKGRKVWNKGLIGYNSGEKSSNWKGGITPINNRIRKSLEYSLWRQSIFARDNYTCIWCGYRGGKIHADHIKPFAYFPELRFAIDNGRTLCIPCHQKTDTWGARANRFKKHIAVNITGSTGL